MSTAKMTSRKVSKETRKPRRSRFSFLGLLTFSIVSLLFLSVFYQKEQAHAETDHSVNDSFEGVSFNYDTVCYLSAKYESNGKCDSTGTDVDHMAYGEYQFYYAYELVPFINWCFEKSPEFYAEFESYQNMSRKRIPDEDFQNAWRSVADADYARFEYDQQDYIVNYTLEPALLALEQAYGYDFINCSDALKACVLSFANRDGKYIENLEEYFKGTTPQMSEKKIIKTAYRRMQKRRPEEKRWVREEKDCLSMLAGKLDVYEPSENDAGGIDWSWKITDLEK